LTVYYAKIPIGNGGAGITVKGRPLKTIVHFHDSLLVIVVTKLAKVV
jgi:hypothetical protein